MILWTPKIYWGVHAHDDSQTRWQGTTPTNLEKNVSKQPDRAVPMWTSLDTNSNKCIVDLNGEVTRHEFSGLSEDPGWKPRCISPRSEKEEATAELPRSWHTPYHGGAQQGRTATWVPLSEFQIQKSHLKSSRSCYCCSLNFPEPAVMDAW